MSKRIRCVFHTESTPSLVLYKESFKCFGCGKRGPLKDLPEGLRPKEGEIEDEEPDDLEEKFRYIESLRCVQFRGLDFPADERGYYLCWPGRDYYKYRLFEPGKYGKYLGPKGHKVPIFWARKIGNQSLYLVEGEINALSLAVSYPGSDVCSVGSASNFSSINLERYLTQFKQYNTITIVVDKDAAGYKALIESKAFFLYKIPFVRFIQLERDCNELLCEKGPEGVREAVQRADSK